MFDGSIKDQESARIFTNLRAFVQAPEVQLLHSRGSGEGACNLDRGCPPDDHNVAVLLCDGPEV